MTELRRYPPLLVRLAIVACLLVGTKIALIYFVGYEQSNAVMTFLQKMAFLPLLWAVPVGFAVQLRHRILEVTEKGEQLSAERMRLLDAIVLAKAKQVTWLTLTFLASGIIFAALVYIPWVTDYGRLVAIHAAVLVATLSVYLGFFHLWWGFDELHGFLHQIGLESKNRTEREKELAEMRAAGSAPPQNIDDLDPDKWPRHKPKHH